jgi:hypothetical protein
MAPVEGHDLGPSDHRSFRLSAVAGRQDDLDGAARQ